MGFSSDNITSANHDQMRCIDGTIYNRIEEPICTLAEAIGDAIVDNDRSGPTSNTVNDQSSRRAPGNTLVDHSSKNDAKTPPFPPGFIFGHPTHV